MKKRLLYKLILIILVCFTLLCGCADKKENKKNEASKAMVIYMRLPESFNPLEVQHQSVRDALSLCYEPLFTLNENMEYSAVLAKSIKLSEDSKSAVIILKDSILWHDGTEFTSADVVHTVNAIKGNVNSPYYECVKNIESVTPLDPHSLSMTFSKPYGQVAYSLYFPIIASHNSNPDEKIIGTGAYSFEDYTAAASLSLKKNADWHGGDVSGEKISVLVMRDDDAASSAFNSGSVNITTSRSYDLHNNPPKNTPQMIEYPSLQYEFLVFNHETDMFSSQAIRAAVSSAINREEIADSAYLCGAYAANSPVHPAAKELAANSESTLYNLSNAQEMLFLEGYSIDENTGLLKNEEGKVLSFDLLVNSDNSARTQAAQLLASQLFLAGIEVNVTEADFESYLEKIQSGNFDAYLGGTTLSNMCDFDFLLSDGATLNNYGYKSDYMSAALTGISSASTDDSRHTALVSFEEVFLREQPICGIVFKNDVLIADKYVSISDNPYPGNPYIHINKWSLK